MRNFLRRVLFLLAPTLLIASLFVPASAAVTPDEVIEELLPGEELVVRNNFV